MTEGSKSETSNVVAALGQGEHDEDMTPSVIQDE